MIDVDMGIVPVAHHNYQLSGVSHGVERTITSVMRSAGGSLARRGEEHEARHVPEKEMDPEPAPVLEMVVVVAGGASGGGWWPVVAGGGDGRRGRGGARAPHSLLVDEHFLVESHWLRGELSRPRSLRGRT
ncbi:hypothetical protein KGM_202861 [Danaus plexippus plexippus]|uniref:Uncharacterized protein n=1 Tax=Danaus plexippus plexippus TaxID=278856 RepID=A0A212F213_DANPL|nr:hypothetical protein KGM_202861 [Danaus plexippus plexippus]